MRKSKDTEEQVTMACDVHSRSPMQYARCEDGVRIAYLTLGEGSPLVFASNIFGGAFGYSGGSPFLAGVASGLVRRGWRVILHDHRGMGASDRDVADLGLDARVRDVAAVVNALGLTRFALAGVDIGAATAVAYTVANPSAVTSLVLLSPFASGTRYLQQPMLRAAYAAEGMGDWKLFGQLLGSVASSFSDPEFVRWGTEGLMRTTTPAGLSEFNEATSHIDIAGLLPLIDLPTLVTHEAPFPFGSFDLCREVAAGIRGAEFVTVEENSIAGRVHDTNIDLIDRFLRNGTVASAVSSAPSSTRHGLTPREVQVLRHVAAGSSNKVIAAALGVAESTVERHLVNLYQKIGARGRADATRFALQHGLHREGTA